MKTSSLPLEEITRLGEKIYSEKYKDLFEKDYLGQYAVIDVEQEKYQIDPDRLAAIEKAKKAFGENVFYIIQIGSTQHTSSNFSAKKYVWNF